MQLNERQIQLVKLLIKESNYKTISAYATDLQMSYKTIVNDLQLLEPFLKKYDVSIEKKPHHGIKLHMQAEQAYKRSQILENLNNTDEYLSINERRAKILSAFLWDSKHYFSIQKFSNEFYVSPSSITHDLDIIEESLKKYDLKLIKSSKGTRLEGTEINIRKGILDYVEIYLNEHGYSQESYHQLQLEFNSILQIEDISMAEILEFLEIRMSQIEAQAKKLINEPYFTSALLYIVIMILRVKQGNMIENQVELSHPYDEIDSNDFKFTQKLIDEIEEAYKIGINDFEAINVYRHFISGGLSQKEIAIVEKNTKENNLNSLTLAYTRYLIEHMSRLFGIDFTNQVYLHSNLRFHIKPMINRLRYDIRINNFMLNEMKKRYPLEFYLTLISCMFTSMRYELKIPSEEEICYLMVYFQTAKERHLQHISALLISQNSVGSTHLLKTRIENAFPDFHVLDILNPTKLDQVDLENIDLILSTGGITMNMPYVNISPFCDDADISSIQQYVRNLKKRNSELSNKFGFKVEYTAYQHNEKKRLLFNLNDSCYVEIYRAEENKMCIEKQIKDCYYGIFYKDLAALYQLLEYMLKEELLIQGQ